MADNKAAARAAIAEALGEMQVAEPKAKGQRTAATLRFKEYLRGADGKVITHRVKSGKIGTDGKPIMVEKPAGYQQVMMDTPNGLTAVEVVFDRVKSKMHKHLPATRLAQTDGDNLLNMVLVCERVLDTFEQK